MEPSYALSKLTKTLWRKLAKTYLINLKFRRQFSSNQQGEPTMWAKDFWRLQIIIKKIKTLELMISFKNCKVYSSIESFLQIYNRSYKMKLFCCSDKFLVLIFVVLPWILVMDIGPYILSTLQRSKRNFWRLRMSRWWWIRKSTALLLCCRYIYWCMNCIFIHLCKLYENIFFLKLIM